MAPEAGAAPATPGKLTRKEKEKAEKELRRRMPPLAQVGRNGVFEMTGSLSWTWAAGAVPGGPFVPASCVCRAHNFYVFDGGEEGSRPTAKPRTFFNIKRADVTQIGLLPLPPPLPPHTNVFRLDFAKKQFGHKSFFFKSTTTRELERWIADLSWRVLASEKEILRKFEPERDRPILQRRSDETETAIFEPSVRINGMAVRYLERNPDWFDSGEDEVAEQGLDPPIARKKT